MAALLVEGYRQEMVLAAAAVAGAALVLAVILLYRQIRMRQAASLALQNAKARVGDIIDSAMDPLIAVDDRQRIVLFNAAAEKAFLTG